MGKLKEIRDNFQISTITNYNTLMKVLGDNYCWKCPMRSTQKISRCREVHAGRLLMESIENGLIEHLKDSNINEIECEAIMARMLKKKIKRQGGKQREATIIFQVQSEQSPDLDPNKWLKININPRRVKIGDEILIPPETLECLFLGSNALISGFPFELAKVTSAFHEGSFWYVEVNKNRILPLESIYGLLLETFNQEDSIKFD